MSSLGKDGSVNDTLSIQYPSDNPDIYVKHVESNDMPAYVANRLCDILFGDHTTFGPMKKEDGRGYDLGINNDYWLFDRGTTTNLQGETWTLFELAHRYRNMKRIWTAARTLIVMEDYPGLVLLNDIYNS